MANESPFTPGSWTEGAPIAARRAADGPNYWANPPTGPQESELYPAPEIEHAPVPVPVPSPLAWTPTVVADPVDEPTVDEPTVDETPMNEPTTETVVDFRVPAAPVIDLRVLDEPVVPAFVATQPRPYDQAQPRPYNEAPAPAPVIDHASETHAVGEYDADEFREVASPVRGGLFARYSPPVPDPLPQSRADRRKRRHGLRSRR